MTPPSPRRRPLGRTLAALAAVAVTMTGLLVTATPALAAAPRPVSAYSTPDPGLVRSGSSFVAYTTGTNARVASAPTGNGPWPAPVSALSSLPTWVDTSTSAGHSVWAPDAVQTSSGWVLYYAAVAKPISGVTAGQRCIGTATASTATGPFTPQNTPLVCPGLGAPDPVAGRPVSAAGVIDASPSVVTIDGAQRLYLTYKTQQTPSSIRMVRLDLATGRSVLGESHELVRNSGIIENPSLVQRGDTFVLFASRYGYDNCSYATVYLTSTHIWSWSDTEHPLLSTASSGICGPGGADVVPALQAGDFRIFLHGWVCTVGGSEVPCTDSTVGNSANHPTRRMYAAVLNWGTNGHTPSVGEFLTPAT